MPAPASILAAIPLVPDGISYLALAVSLGVLGAWAYEFHRRRVAEKALREAAAQAEQEAQQAANRGGAQAMPPGARALQAQRETIAFEQHRRLNELAHQKMSLEIRALETQIKLMEADLRRRDDAGEHASAALEKTRLEVESLRLHIREQRKRLDDYGQFE